MCGISGFVGFFEPDLVKKMNRIQSHRGPDGDGIWSDRKRHVSLGHRRLSIIDLSSKSNQPMIDHNDQVVIVYNGELYNYLTLRTQLIDGGGVSFITNSDTEVIIEMYLRHGHSMLSKLNGIFAFAIFDKRDKTLFVARDGMGIKPFYYSECDKGFIFSSELKAILLEDSIDRTLDPQTIYFHLIYLWAPSPHTMLKSVKKLEPGHAMIVSGNKIKKKWQFYDLPYQEHIETVSIKDTVRQTQDHIRKAVESQMVSDVPVGAFLSGGLDSSAVVTFAQSFNPNQKLQCFSIDYSGKAASAAQAEGFVNDLPYASRVAKRLGVDLHVVQAGTDLVQDFEKMIYHLDEPQADAAPLGVYAISKLAKEHGIKVLLSGSGGDDIFTGYRRHYALMQERYWAWMPLQARKMLKQMSGFGSVDSAWRRRVSKAFQYANLDGDNRLKSYFNWIDPDVAKGLLTSECRVNLESGKSDDPLLTSLDRLPSHVHPLNRMLYLDSKYFLTDHNLNYTDKMGMAVGVEIRVPLLDPGLMSFAAQLPVRYKQKGKTGKWIFKKAMEDFLPNDIIYRPKSGFGTSIKYLLENNLLELKEDLLSSHSLKSRGIFDPNSVRELMEKERSGRVYAAYTIFSILCIELWCRIFLDRPMSEYL